MKTTASVLLHLQNLFPNCNPIITSFITVSFRTSFPPTSSYSLHSSENHGPFSLLWDWQELHLIKLKVKGEAAMSARRINDDTLKDTNWHPLALFCHVEMSTFATHCPGNAYLWLTGIQVAAFLLTDLCHQDQEVHGQKRTEELDLPAVRWRQAEAAQRGPAESDRLKANLVKERERVKRFSAVFLCHKVMMMNHNFSLH